MTKKIKKRKGLSPVIATILLVAMVIVMGTIVFIWMRGSIKEVVYKFSGENIELACESVSFDAEYNSVTEKLNVVNNGDVAIKNFKVQLITGGKKTTFNLNREEVSFSGITSGNGENVDVKDEGIKDADEILVIPILQGRNDAGTLKDYVCDEKYGVKIYLKK